MFARFLCAAWGIIVGMILMRLFTLNDRDKLRRYERELGEHRTINIEQKRQIEHLQKHIDNLVEIGDLTPPDCKLGPWCEGCLFAKTYHVCHGRYKYYTKIYCSKNEACPNFIQKQNEEEA